jgi:hypothetical protein
LRNQREIEPSILGSIGNVPKFVLIVAKQSEIVAYGVTWAKEATPAFIELSMSFDIHPPNTPSLHTAEGFLGAFEHLKRGIDLIWNREAQLLIWNEWSELMLKEMLENREWSITGPSASWKSTCAAIYAVAFWLADPLRTKVIISSTTLGGLRERIWKDIVNFYRASQCGFGNVIQHPTPKIQTQRGDDATGIHGVAVEQGDVNKAIDKIKGRHAPRMLMEVDEGTGAQAAIIDAGMNLETGCETFQFGLLQNACSYFDQGGRISEPKDGWNSVTVENEKWETKRGGVCIHLDGLKSPNVLAGYKKYPGMISQEDIDIAARRDGENSPRFWQERRGFWPPEGMADTVLSESMFVKFRCSDKPIWVGNNRLIAALDPAYGGDRCVLRIAKVGMIDEPELGQHHALSLEETLVLKLDVTSKEPIHFQVARMVREECISRGIDAEYFGMDATGIGDGTADIFKREWSEDFLEVKFGGYPSDRPVSDINPRPCREQYANKVTELWFGFRVAVEQNQIRNLDVETAQEFCQRKADYKRYAPRVIVESKSDMKARSGRSPDLADAAVILIELAKHRNLLPSDYGGEVVSKKSERWLDFAKRMTPRKRYGVAA